MRLLPLFALTSMACASVPPPSTAPAAASASPPSAAPSLAPGTIALQEPADSCVQPTLGRTLELERADEGWVLRYDRAAYPVTERAQEGSVALRFVIRESEWITFDDHAHDFQLHQRFEYRLRLEGERVHGTVDVEERDPDSERTCALPIEGRFTPR